VGRRGEGGGGEETKKGEGGILRALSPWLGKGGRLSEGGGIKQGVTGRGDGRRVGKEKGWPACFSCPGQVLSHRGGLFAFRGVPTFGKDPGGRDFFFFHTQNTQSCFSGGGGVGRGGKNPTARGALLRNVPKHRGRRHPPGPRPHPGKTSGGTARGNPRKGPPPNGGRPPGHWGPRTALGGRGRDGGR